MSLLFLLLVTTLPLLITSAPPAPDHAVGWPKEWPQHLRDMKDTQMFWMLRQRLRPTPKPWESSDSRLLIRDRAGMHIFWMHNGQAVDARLGIDRSYRIRQGVFFNEVCTCNRRSSKPRRACVRHYKPAFYGLVAGSCIAALLLLAALIWSAVACSRRLRQARAFGHKLLIEEVVVDNGEKGRHGKGELHWPGEDTSCVKNIEKVPL